MTRQRSRSERRGEKKIKIHFLYHNIIPTLSSSKTTHPPAVRRKAPLHAYITNTALRKRILSRLPSAFTEPSQHESNSVRHARHVTAGSIDRELEFFHKRKRSDVTARKLFSLPLEFLGPLSIHPHLMVRESFSLPNRRSIIV